MASATADPLDTDEAPTLAGIRRSLSQVPPLRLVATLLTIALAVLFARFSWHVPLAVDAERALYDVRALQAAMAHPAATDPRLLLVVYTPDTQQATGKRSPLDRALLARALANLDALHPRAIGIDMLLDMPQPEDPALLAAFRAMKTPVRLAFSNSAWNAEDITPAQQGQLDAMFAAVRGTVVRPASVRIETDPDNVARGWPAQPPGLPPLLPMALTGTEAARSYQGSILYRLPRDAERRVFESLPIDLFATPAGAAMLAPMVRGRIVLIGGDLPDEDRFTTPESRLADSSTPFGRRFREDVPGLEVNAAMVAQLLDGRLPGAIGGGALWLLALLVVLSGTFTAMLDVRPSRLALVVFAEAAFYCGTPFLFENMGIDTRDLPAFGWLGGWLIAFVAIGAAVRASGSEQRRFAQGALGKYLPRDIAAEILRNPKRLALNGEKRPIFALFSDLEGFTRMSHAIPPEQVATILNRYLDGLSAIVLEHGGTIDKFVGDAIVAFWGAPIARPDDGARAGRAALAIAEFGHRFAASSSGDGPRLGRTRVGLHHGDAIVGNFGGEGRFQYTALGDAMNCASRLESANKSLHTTALVSDSARLACAIPALRPMGRIVLSGRSTPITVWEPAAAMAAAERDALNRLWERFDGGDLAALDAIAGIAERHPDDAALAHFVYRLRESGPGGSFALREK